MLIPLNTALNNGLPAPIGVNVSIDFETRAIIDLKSVGARRYAQDPHTDALCCGIKIGPAEAMWVPGHPIPALLVDAIARGEQVAAYNASFEIAIWQEIMATRYGWPALPVDRFTCTMQRAALAGLPGALERAATALRLSVRKDTEGHRLMLKMCKPLPATKGDTSLRWHDDPEDHLRLQSYCMDDCRVEVLAASMLPEPSPMEAAVMVVDRRINIRGMRVDRAAAIGAAKIARVEKARLNGRMKEVTGGTIGSTNQVAAILTFVQRRGVHIDRLRASDVRDILAEDEEGATSGDLDVTEDMLTMYGLMNPDAKEVLTLRAEAAKASTSKLDAIVNGATEDSRLVDLFAYAGATKSGRWAGRKVQVQNLPRSNPLCAEDDVELWYETLATGDYDKFRDLVPPDRSIMDGLKASLRGLITASPGNLLVAADLSQIEARITAWAAGQFDVIDAFIELDAAVAAGAPPDVIKSLDIYTVAGRKMQSDRQAGKIATLACLGPDTRVLIRRLHVVTECAITAVQTTDEVWDGVEWVQQSGLVSRGERMTLRLSGVSVTGDHLILCGNQWCSASEVVSRPNISRLALATGSRNLPSPGTLSVTPAGYSPSGSSVAAVPRNTRSARRISIKGNRLGAAAAHWLKQLAPAQRSITDTLTCLPMLSIADACSTAYRPASAGATAKTETGITWTGGLRSIPHGEKTSGVFWPTLSRSKGGISRISTLIGSTTTKDTSRETCGSLPDRRTSITGETSAHCNAESETLNSKMQVYDLASCGPRNRFTIITDDGPLIVHNCGFQGGAHALMMFGLIYGVKFSEEKAQETVDAWRMANPRIVNAWAAEEKAAMKAIRNPGIPYPAGTTGVYLFRSGNLMRRIPSGRVLVYRRAAIENLLMPWGKRKASITYEGNVYAKGQPGTFIRLKTYGGALFQRVVQAIARDVLAAGLIRAQRAGLSCALHVHDEQVLDTPADKAEAHAKILVHAMTDPIDWLPDLPMTSSADISARYRKN